MIPDVLIHADAECQVLAAALASADGLALALTETTADCYAVPAHRTLYRVLTAIAHAGTTVESAVLREQYRALGLGTFPGEMLVEIAEVVSPVVNVPHWAALLRDRRDRRATYDALHQHADRAADLSTPLSDTAAAATTALTSTGPVTRPPFRVLVDDAMDHIESEHKHGLMPGWPSGLAQVDHLTRGWQRGQLTLIAARPSVGKTQFAGFCAREVLSAEEPVLFVTAEMSARQLARRFLALEAGVDLLHLTDHGWSLLAKASGALAGWRLTLDAHSTTPGMVRLEAERVKRAEGGLALIVVDYVQLFRGDGRSENRNLEVGAVGRGLQRLALDLDVPVLALSQLSRDIEKGGTVRKPRLSDLRDSGELEQAADLVAFLHAREEEDDVIQGRRRVDFILAKNRHGQRGTVELESDGTGKWRERQWTSRREVA